MREKMCLSSTLLRMHKREIRCTRGTLVCNGDFFGDFGMGTTKEVFQTSGTFPSLIERLKRLITEGAIQKAGY